MKAASEQAARERLYKRFYGEIPPLNPEHFVRFAKAIKTVASADGKLSQNEWDELVSLGRDLGATEDVIAEVDAYDAKESGLAALFEGVYDPHATRALLYDAIRVASVDGYHEKEKACVARAAKILKVDDSTLATIEGIVELEAVIAGVKKRVFHGGK
jgi:hypothetical protein